MSAQTSGVALTVVAATLLSEFLPEEQLAADFGISLKSLRRWERERTGPPVTKIGRRSYYKKTSVLAWLASREEANRTPHRRRSASNKSQHFARR